MNVPLNDHSWHLRKFNQGNEGFCVFCQEDGIYIVSSNDFYDGVGAKLGSGVGNRGV